MMKKILIINTVGFRYDGINSVILNYTRGMDREGLYFTFLVCSDTDPSLRETLEWMGRIVQAPDRKKDTCGYIIGLLRLLKEGFDVIHIHGNSGTMLIEVLLAKLYKVKNVIIHGHNTRTNHPILNFCLKMPMMHMADTCIACSEAAGSWLYGKYPYIVLNNAIDLSHFSFSKEARIKYRTEFGVNEAFLIGHAGNFVPQKNHFFLIDIFHEFHNMEPNSKLLLLSDGPQLDQVKEKVMELGLQNSVIFAGRRNDLGEIYSAMDMFILPSLWEGLPLTIVEAQANGLLVLLSDTITKAVECTDRVVFAPLTGGAFLWAEYIKEMSLRMFDRENTHISGIAEKGFDIFTEAEKLHKIYMRD